MKEKESKKKKEKVWMVAVTQDGKELSRVPLTKEKTFLGRMVQNHIVLDHPSVSRTHAMIFRVNDKFFLVDQGSQNGILMNGRAILHEEIKVGDLITIGPFLLKLVPGSDPGNKIISSL